MAATAILATGSADAASTDFTLAAGESATLSLKDAAGPAIPDGAFVDVQIKSSDAEYFNIGALTAQQPCLVLSAVGTFRVSRRSGGGVSVGVDKS